MPSKFDINTSFSMANCFKMTRLFNVGYSLLGFLGFFFLLCYFCLHNTVNIENDLLSVIKTICHDLRKDVLVQYLANSSQLAIIKLNQRARYRNQPRMLSSILQKW